MIRPVAALLLVSLATHAETCRFTGTTGYDGRLAVRADTTQVDDLLCSTSPSSSPFMPG